VNDKIFFKDFWFLLLGMVYLLCLSANGLPVTDAPNRKVTVKDIYENFHQYLSPDALQFLEEEINSVSIEEDEYFELNGKKILAADLYQLLELEEQKYAHWFFMSVPSDILHDNATSKFEFNDPAYGKFIFFYYYDKKMQLQEYRQSTILENNNNSPLENNSCIFPC